jgi:hypothetical protein
VSARQSQKKECGNRFEYGIVPVLVTQTVSSVLFCGDSMIFLFACSAPIDAPEDLNSLLSYVYTHAIDEDESMLRAGIENMSVFSKEHEADLREGFTVRHISQEALDSTPEDFVVDPELYGVSVQYFVPYSPDDIAYCNTAVNGAEVYSANYLSYEREHLTNLDCFLDQTCPVLRFRSTILSSLPFGVEMLSKYINELRWIEINGSMAFVQRSWMEGLAESTADWANMEANFYVSVTLPSPEGSETIAASWAAVQLGDLSVPEDLAKSQAIDGLKANGEDVTAWLSENDIPR